MSFISAFHRIREFLRHIFSNIPVLGPLVYCKWVHHKECIREMSIILIFSTASFWLTSIILTSHAAMRSLGFDQVLLNTVKNGELFIFTVGFLGPILMHTSEENFPGRLWHFLALVILGLLAPAFHSQVKLAQFSGKIVAEDMEYLFHISVGLAATAIVLRYLAMVYRKSTAGFKPENEMKLPENNFASAYASHRSKEAGK